MVGPLFLFSIYRKNAFFCENWLDKPGYMDFILPKRRREPHPVRSRNYVRSQFLLDRRGRNIKLVKPLVLPLKSVVLSSA